MQFLHNNLPGVACPVFHHLSNGETSMTTLRAFFLGMAEFRLSFTTHIADNDTQHAYDTGREWAHRLTFRHFDN